MPTRKPLTNSWLNQLQSCEADERVSILCDEIKQLIHQEMGVIDKPSISIDKGFFEMGLDSVQCLTILGQIESQLEHQIELDEVIIFNYPNIISLATFILEEISINEDHTNPSEAIIDSGQIQHNESDIAIIGMSGLFPGAKDLDAFWDNLLAGTESIKPLTASHFIEDKDNLSDFKAGLVENVNMFDAGFFSISPREAQYLDPQQRILLKQTYIALENAGIQTLSLKNTNTGVFIGLSTNDYLDIIKKQYSTMELDPYVSTGNSFSTASGRIAYTFGLQGPCMSIDSACSSSLVAVDTACQKILQGDCSIAIAGGANIILDPALFSSFSKSGMLSKDGKCKVFDESADGYVRGEGCGIVVLKKYSEAIKDNDNIIAVIKSSNVNQDGFSSGLTVPNGIAQRKLIQGAVEKSMIDFSDIDFIECHGTGTALGDPIETSAITNLFENNTNKKLYLSSTKANVGHLEAAAGIVGLIKSALCLQHKTLPLQANFSSINPKIKLSDNITIPTSNVTFNKSSALNAGVSSFGFSGTNAHLVISENLAVYNSSVVEKNNDSQYLFVMSAKSQKSLDLMVTAYIAYLNTTTENIANICYTTLTGRNHYQYRLACIAKTHSDVINFLSQHKPGTIKQLNNNNPSIKTTDIEVLAQKYQSGKVDNFDYLFENSLSNFKKVVLPNYCFDEQSHWVKNKNRSKITLISNKPFAPQNKPLDVSTKISANNTDIPKLVSTWVAECLSLDKIDTKDFQKGFFEMGLDSITALELKQKIERHFDQNVRIEIGEIFQNSTVNKLANHIERISSGGKKNVTPLPPPKYTVERQLSTSKAQQLFYKMFQFSPNDLSNKMDVMVTIENNISFNKLITGIEIMLNSVTALNSKFVEEDQLVLEFDSTHIHKVCIATTKNDFEQKIAEYQNTAFIPTSLPLIRVLAFKENNIKLFVSAYHGILDGIGFSMLLNNLYAFINKTDEPEIIISKLNGKPNTFSENLNIDKNYWQSKLVNFRQVVPPTWNLNLLNENNSTDCLQFQLNKKATEKIKQLAKIQNTTTSQIVLFSLGTIMTNMVNDDCAIGFVFGNRTNMDTKDAANLQINTLPLIFEKNTFTLNDKYSVFANNMLDLMKRSMDPVLSIMELIKPKALKNRSVFYDILFNYVPDDILFTTEHNNITVEYLRRNANSLLTLYMRENLETISFEWYYRKNVIQEAEVNLLNTKITNLVDNLLIQQDQHSSNENTAPILNKKPSIILQPIFEACHSNEVCFISGDTKVTYKELKTISDSIQVNLDKCQPGIILIDGHANTYLYASIIACIFSQLKYLIVDPSWDKSKRDTFYKTIDVSCVCTTQAYLNDYECFDLIVSDQLTKTQQTAPKAPNNKDWLMYNVFSSGSTGEPKRSEALASAVMHFITWQAKAFNIDHNDVVAQMTTPGFDVFYRDFLTPFIANATIAIPPEPYYYANEHCGKWLKNTRVSMLHIVPTIAQSILDNLEEGYQNEQLRLTFFAGEMLTADLVSKWKRCFPNTRVINLYGPSETVLAKCFFEVQNEHLDQYSIMPVGKPFGDNEIIIIDDSGIERDILEPGEVVIKPNHKVSGYFNNYEVKTFNYSTSDLGYIDIQGNLHLVGRKDNVVKINGIKVDITEIEKSFLNALGYGQGIMTFDSKNNTVLGFVKLPSDIPSKPDFIKRIVQKMQQDNVDMLPSKIYDIPEFPLLTSGKINRKALSQNVDQFELVFPCSTTQAVELHGIDDTLQTIWKDVLGDENCSLDDDFYLLGGTSLMLVQLMTKVNKAYSIKITLQDISNNLSLRSLAQIIKNKIEFAETTTSQVERFSCSQLLSNFDTDLKKIPDMVGACTFEYKPKIIETVFLTGTTGYLGAYLLKTFVQNKFISTIYCLVRAPNQEAGLKRIQSNLAYYNLILNEEELAKVSVVTGDLNKENFGLSSKQYDNLSSNIDTICHSAAYVDFLLPLNKLYSTNVASLEHIFKFSNASQAIVNFVSTVGIFPSSEEYAKRDFDESNNIMFNDKYKIIGGYAQSKWLAEILCSKFQEQGFPVNIYRPGRVFPSLKEKISEPNDFIINLLLSFYELKVAPDISVNIDLNPIDLVANVIYQGTINQEMNQYYNIVNPNRLYVKDVINLFKNVNVDVETLSYAQWYDTLEASIISGQYCSLAPFFPLFDKNIDNLPRLKFNRSFSIHHCNTTLLKNGLRFEPIPHKDLISVFRNFYDKKNIEHILYESSNE